MPGRWGPVKNRAFLIAMATGLPIVPIVIRNSETVAGRNAAKLNPGTVDIAVLPPVSVENWTCGTRGKGSSRSGRPTWKPWPNGLREARRPLTWPGQIRG